jgi:cytoskeleton protein RodZ
LAMGAFGERLRREREMRGITLDEISESTKISRRHLEALEKEDFDSLPGGVFNRGFVRAYARFLGLDEEQAVADYAAVTAEQAPPPDQFPLEVHEKPDPKLNPRRSTLPLVLALLALVAVLAIFWAKNRNRPEQKTPISGTTGASTGATAVSPSPTATPGGEQPATSETPAAANPTPAPTAPAATPSPEQTFLVVIKAREDAWVSLSADGQRAWEGILKAQKQRAVRAGKRIELTTGNLGGLVINHNGKSLGVLGNQGEVRTLIFTPAGLVQ